MGAGFFLASMAISVAVAEIVFRWYEHAYLTREPESGGKEIDLKRLGFNDTSVPRLKPKGEFRILSFGDSFAQAIVRYPSTYHGVAAELASRASGRRVRIVNLGEAGTTFQHYIRAYRYWSKRIEHDAVIFNTFMGNDLPDSEALPPVGDLVNHRIFTPYGGEPEELRKPLALVPYRYPLRILDYLYAHVMAVLHPGLVRGPGSRGGLFPTAYPIPGNREIVFTIERMMAVTYDPGASEKLTNGYAQFIRLLRLMTGVRTQGKPVLLMLSPSQFQVDPRFMKMICAEKPGLDLDLPVFLAQEAVRKADPALAVLNLTTAFRCAAAGQDDLYARDNTHWDVAGNRLAGIVLARFISERWLDRTTPAGDADAKQPCRDVPLLGRVEARSPGRIAATKVVLSPVLAGSHDAGPTVGARYARLVGTTIDAMEAGGRANATIALDPGSNRGSKVTGRITDLPPAVDSVILGISSGPTIQAVAPARRTAPGEWRFSAWLSGPNENLEYHIVSPEEGTLKLRLIQTASMRLDDCQLVQDAASGLEILAYGDGRRMQILPGLLNGRVERAEDLDEFIDLWGIAAVDRPPPLPRRADGILVFSAGRLVYRGWTAWERHGLADALGAPGCGFRFAISKRFTGDPVASGIRVFAIVSPGVVSELRYPVDYKWSKPAGRGTFLTPDLRDAILNPASKPPP